ncbi:IS66 family transposase [Sinorhizobium meliloti]
MIEAIRGAPPDRRKIVRRRQSKPKIEALRRWWDKMLTELPRSSSAAEAIRYAITRWASLCRFLNDGTIEIDNNAPERAIRAILSLIEPRSSTVSIPRPTFTTSSRASPIIRSAGSTNCCLGACGIKIDSSSRAAL